MQLKGEKKINGEKKIKIKGEKNKRRKKNSEINKTKTKRNSDEKYQEIWKTANGNFSESPNKLKEIPIKHGHSER